MTALQAILLDLDGTVLDTSEFILQAMEHAFRIHALPVPERAALSATVGLPLEECYRTLLKRQEVEEFVLAHNDFQRGNMGLSRLFPHALATLQTLKNNGFKLAIITNRHQDTVLSTLRQEPALGGCFDLVICREDVTHLKPHPEPLLKALMHFSIPGTSALMVGDSPFDILAGRAALVPTVGALYGFHGPALREFSPDYTIDDLSELPTLIENSIAPSAISSVAVAPSYPK